MKHMSVESLGNVAFAALVQPPKPKLAALLPMRAKILYYCSSLTTEIIGFPNGLVLLLVLLLLLLLIILLLLLLLLLSNSTTRNQ